MLGDSAGILEAAAWLHDIGYSPLVRSTGFHPLNGARYFRDVVMADDMVRRLVAHHTGALVEADERGIGDLADEFPLPDQELLDALTYCDVTTDPDGCRVGVEERLSEIMILRRSTPDRPEGMRWSRLTSAIRPQFLPWLKNRPDVPAYGASKAGASHLR